MTVDELRRWLSDDRIPGDTLVVCPGMDHSYYRGDVCVAKAVEKGRDLWEWYGEKFDAADDARVVNVVVVS